MECLADKVSQPISKINFPIGIWADRFCDPLRITVSIGAAIKPGITLEAGKVKQSNFHDSPLLRIGLFHRHGMDKAVSTR